MLNIYYADALTDREAFIFDHIDPAKKTILLVPDQFSLQAERDALRMSGQKALLELMVTDFNQLGHKVVHELEGHEPQIIDKYGRHMLLSVLIERMDEELTVFRGRKGRSAFADHMNTMISELKRYEISPDRLGETIDQLKQGSGDPARRETPPAPRRMRPAPRSPRPGSASGTRCTSRPRGRRSPASV